MVQREGKSYEILVWDSRQDGSKPTYCFSNFTIAYLYAGTFFETDDQKELLPHQSTFQRNLEKKGTYTFHRGDEYYLKFQLCQKLNKEEITLLSGIGIKAD